MFLLQSPLQELPENPTLFSFILYKISRDYLVYLALFLTWCTSLIHTFAV